MVIFDENNKSIQIKRFLSKSTRVPHANFYICKKVIFFENFDYRATLKLRKHLEMNREFLLVLKQSFPYINSPPSVNLLN